MPVPGPAPQIICSHLEAAFLASTLGTDALLGIPDPVTGWLTEEVQEAWEEVRRSLGRRRWISTDPSGQLFLDSTVAALIGTWAFPECSFAVELDDSNGSPSIRFFHVTRYLAVQQELVGRSSCQLTALEDAIAVYERVVQLLTLREQPAAEASTARLSATAFEAARQQAMAEGPPRAASTLRDAGLEEADAGALASTLARASARASVIALAFRSASWEVGATGFVGGEQGLWRVRRTSQDGLDWIEATPCSATQARDELRRVMNRVLAEPLPSRAAVEGG